MDNEKLFELLGEIRDALIGIPQYDGEYEIDENDEGYFQITELDESVRPITDEELRSMYPVIWARRNLEKIIQSKP